jgi:hypothetical protein
MSLRRLKSCASPILFMFCLWTAATIAQNPPMTGDPYASRGNPKSPDGKYEWIIKTTNPIRYQLVSLPAGKTVASVNAYYPEANSSNVHYAKACGIFWNQDGTVVALDELNRRRAGHLYFFILRNGKVNEIRSEDILPIPSSSDENRVVVDPGWVSGTEIRVRQALKTKAGEFVSKYFTIDFADPNDVKIKPAR